MILRIRRASGVHTAAIASFHKDDLTTFVLQTFNVLRPGCLNGLFGSLFTMSPIVDGLTMMKVSACLCSCVERGASTPSESEPIDMLCFPNRRTW